MNIIDYILVPVAKAQQATVQLQDPLNIGSQGLPGIAQNITKGLLGVIGVVALLMFIYSGFLLLTARGNKDQVGKAKSTMVYSVLGLAVIFFSYTILNFVLDFVSK